MNILFLILILMMSLAPLLLWTVKTKWIVFWQGIIFVLSYVVQIFFDKNEGIYKKIVSNELLRSFERIDEISLSLSLVTFALCLLLFFIRDELKKNYRLLVFISMLILLPVKIVSYLNFQDIEQAYFSSKSLIVE